QRVSLRRILLTVRRTVHPLATALGVTAIMVATAVGWIFVCASWTLLLLAAHTWSFLKRFLTVLMLVLLGLCVYGGRTLRFIAQLPLQASRAVGRAAAGVFAKIRCHSAVICGTLIEATSGALVGAVLLNLRSIHGLLFLPDVEHVAARVSAAAVFGAFLGL